MSVSKFLQEEGDESYETTETMDPELYRAVTEGDVLGFVGAMEHGTMDRHHHPQASCVQLGPQKNTVLHLATSFRQYEIVKIICQDLPFYVAEKNAKGDTPLHVAARAGDTLMVTLLINTEFKEGGLSEKNDEGNTALHEALLCGHQEVARILISKNPNMCYSLNKEDMSLLYLAAEAGFVTIVKLLLENPVGNYSLGSKHKIKSPVFAAILGKNTDVVKLLWYKDQSSFFLRSSSGENPLHAAVCMGYTEGVKFLLNKHYEFGYQKDDQGSYPIHLASNKGLVDIIELMLQTRPDMRELLNRQGQNILHISARSGKCQAVDFMLKKPEIEKLINEKDEDGNTPLHLATIYEHPKTVSSLVKNGNGVLKSTNNNHQTALDIAEEHMETGLASFQKRLTWFALRLYGVPRTHRAKSIRSTSFKLRNQIETESWRDKVNVILLVATVIATITFNAGFTIPGGYNNNTNPDYPDQGIATMLKKVKFQAFVICDAVAMYSSIIVAVTLLWAQHWGPGPMHAVLRFVFPILGISLVMLSVAFTAGLYLVVSKLNWLAHVVLLMGTIFTIALVVLYIPLCFLGSSNYLVFRRVSYYPFYLVLYTLGA